MIEIKRVTNKKELKLFVDYPNVLNKDNPVFIPATFSDDMEDWDRKKNPAFEYCDAEAYLAYRDGRIVGRVGVILSHRANEKWGTKRLRFTQVDFIDDEEVSKALFYTVEKYAREHNCNEVHGPLGFTDMDREGMLVEGFDRPNQFFTYYNQPYYIDHLEKLGYGKDVDWVELKINVPPEDSHAYQRMKRISDRVMKRHNLHVAKIRSHLDYPPYIKKVFNLVNEAYSPLYGTVELSETQIKKYVGKFLPLINPDYAVFVMDENENMIAFGVAAPSIASALKKSNGRYLPFGWIGLLKSLKKNTFIDLLLIAVKPEYQKAGINAVVISKMAEGCYKNNIQYAESGPMLELNDKVLAQWKTLDTEFIKRRRCFIKKIEE
ncbi:MAG: hypothetical protein KBS83_05685 [Lachnospiraceae bacterium]|nr:hypothetical protein [Candidatus Equihabitans merdae]